MFYYKEKQVKKLQGIRMCISATESSPFHQIHTSKNRRRLKRSKLQVQRLTRRRCTEEKVGKDIELKNLQLYLENQTIIEENEKLRERANILHQENLALMTELQKKFQHLDRFDTALFILFQRE
ncbi:protein LITTLE ZIPPER 2-like isoform X1 [Momordica charantia]|uniref:Protein LITTLE ZIPPER 2-like isoform X1 n=1 Tax=Momordica charantia TaxID=3673 RepID=A0A6J1E319_MOMCH|nr:protein LITTLE ZIPPER 2-like isoform X1 [Momordica charantia]